MSAPFATLPMYDWPEIRGATDALWASIRDRLHDAGLPAPDRLTRGGDLMSLWKASGLVLGQTCGLPYVRHLRGRVELVGTPDYGLPGCLPGWYASALVVRADDPRLELRAFGEARLAVNEAGSQSGAQAMMQALARIGVDARFFGEVVVTGGHDASARAVARGTADIAALDAVTWRLIGSYRAHASALRVLAVTQPTPGLPFIAARGRPAERIGGAVAAAIDWLPAADRAALGLRGFVPMRSEDYDLVASRDAANRALSAAHGL